MRNRGLLVTSLTLALLLLGGTARAQVELKNDSFNTGDTAAFQGGFVVGEIGAARFMPTGPCTITKIQLLFGGAATTQTVTLHIWDDSAQTNIPGSELMTATDVQLTGSSSAMSEIDISALGTVNAGGPFRVGFEWQHAGYPSIARDNDGNTYPDRNYIKDSGGNWVRSQTYLVTGDWIIRAFVVYGAQVDAGMQADAAQQLDASTRSDAGSGADAGGGACQGNPDCPGGQYCGPQNTCTYDCITDSDCGDGTCNSLGKCVAKSSSGCSVGPRGATGARPGGLLGGAALLGLALALALGLGRRRR